MPEAQEIVLLDKAGEPVWEICDVETLVNEIIVADVDDWAGLSSTGAYNLRATGAGVSLTS